MKKSVFISEHEKMQISSMYRILKESNSQSTCPGRVVLIDNENNKSYEPNLKVNLVNTSDANKKYNVLTDNDGYFVFTNIDNGEYVISCNLQARGYYLKEIKIKLDNNSILDSENKIIPNLLIDINAKIQDFKEVDVKVDINKKTIINLEFVDEFNNPLVGVSSFVKKKININKDYLTSDNSGKISDIIIGDDESQKSVEISYDYNGIDGDTEFDIIPLNGYQKNDKINYVPKINNKNLKKIIIQTKLDFKIEVFPSNVVLNKNNTKIYDSDNQLITQNSDGGYTYTISKNKKNKIEVDIVYPQYKNYSKKFRLVKDKNIKVGLEKIIIPEPKDLNFRRCSILTKKFYVLAKNYQENPTKPKDSEISSTKIDVEGCAVQHYKKYSIRTKKRFKWLTNMSPNLKQFELSFNKQQQQSIYEKSNHMSITNSIQKVIFEHLEKKQNVFEEKQLIKKRFRFSLNGVNKNKRRVVESLLRNEKRFLINSGYSSKIVNETFLDVMNSLYGSEGNNVLKDVKLRLGQKIADQVKNKEDEHSMILSAFEELPEDVVERAIKENRVDELSSLISQKAIEGYKVKFGTEGISGIMFSSLDENKFKMEVSKLIEPAIKEITTKMEEKFKQVKDAFGGSDLSSSI